MTAGSAGGAMSGEQPRVMVIQAHPDDAEFLCAGTVARLVQSGYRVPFVTLALPSLREPT